MLEDTETLLRGGTTLGVLEQLRLESHQQTEESCGTVMLRCPGLCSEYSGFQSVPLWNLVSAFQSVLMHTFLSPALGICSSDSSVMYSGSL